jgi:predicted Zn-dependent protease
MATMHRTSTSPRGLACIFLLFSMGWAACATNPVTGRREFALMSEAQEIATGRQLDADIVKEMGLYDDKGLQEYVSGIGLRLAALSQRPNLPWHFAVVDVPAVNAFALPGGYIYITRGILPYLDNEAELAGVLGHEIGHVTARHAVQSYTRSTGAGLGLLLGGLFVPAVRPFGQLAESGLGILFLKYGRDDENEADQLGADYIVQGGWDPSALPRFLTTLSRIDEGADRRGIPNWLSTHPQSEDRAQRVSATAATTRSAAAPSAQWAVNRDEYRRRIDGIVFGDNPAEGVVRGNVFVHPGLRLSMAFPQGWEVSNGKAQVVAQEPGNEVYMILQTVEDPRGRTIAEIAQRNMYGSGFAEREGAASTINDLAAYVGTYSGSSSEMGAVLVRAAHIESGRNTFLLAGLAQAKVYDRVARDFSDAIRSFRQLSLREAEDIRPNRLGFYTVRAGDTWQSIAQGAGQGLVKASTLAIMNNHATTDQPAPGERVKIAVAG